MPITLAPNALTTNFSFFTLQFNTSSLHSQTKNQSKPFKPLLTPNDQGSNPVDVIPPPSIIQKKKLQRKLQVG